VEQVAENLGNTPAVCKSSYIDPRVLDHFSSGSTISSRLAARMVRDPTNPMARQAVEAAVIDLLRSDEAATLAA
jgi:DNA topoisomerase IB